MSKETLVAGRELDGLVAEKVMGCKVWKNPVGNPYCRCVGPAHGHHLFAQLGVEVKSYSTDIAASWEVWNKVKENGEGYFSAFLSDLCIVTGAIRQTTHGCQPYSMAMYLMGPLDICRAALRRVEA